MQNIPCEVRAYLRFSILRLQFLQRKQVAQKAWSPVRIARSSILLPQALQLYVQLLHINDPSPSKRRFASESSKVPQVLHRKQLRCHRLPAIDRSIILNLDIGTLMMPCLQIEWKDCCSRTGIGLLEKSQCKERNGSSFNLPSSNAFPSSRICESD